MKKKTSLKLLFGEPHDKVDFENLWVGNCSRSMTNSASVSAMIPWKVSGGLMQQREAQVPPGPCPLFRYVVASPGTCLCCLKGTVGLGSAQPLCFKGNVTCRIFEKQELCLVVDGFQPLLRMEQGNRSVLKMERRHLSMLFLLTSLPACLVHPAEFAESFELVEDSVAQKAELQGMVVCRANASKCHSLDQYSGIKGCFILAWISEQ